jgi:hypothetical protein
VDRIKPAFGRLDMIKAAFGGLHHIQPTFGGFAFLFLRSRSGGATWLSITTNKRICNSALFLFLGC